MFTRRLFTSRSPLRSGFRAQIRPMSLRTLARQYGGVAVGTYLTLSFSVFCGCLTAINVLGIDQRDVSRWFDVVKRTVGLVGTEEVETKEIKVIKEEKTKEMTDSKQEEILNDNWKWSDYLPEWTQHPNVIKFSTTFLLAMAMTKLFTPIKVAVTVAIVPTVARTLRRLGYIKSVPLKK